MLPAYISCSHSDSSSDSHQEFIIYIPICIMNSCLHVVGKYLQLDAVAAWFVVLVSVYDKSKCMLIASSQRVANKILHVS